MGADSRGPVAPSREAPAEAVGDALSEFAELNRRRLFGAPPLSVDELERWLELRERLETRLAGGAPPTAEEGAERRRNLRLPTRLRVELRTPEGRDEGQVRDLSQGGLFVAAPRPLEPGCRVVLEVLPPGRDEPLVLPGRVAWTRSEHTRGRPRGMGIEFLGLDPGQRQELSSWVLRVAERAD